MLRLREMRSALEKAKTQGVSMQRRLVLYWFSMALAILAAVLLVVSLTGVFSNTAQKFGQSLTIQKHNTTSALAGQMDQLTAQSIALSEELTRELDKQLAAGGRTFSALNDDPGAIAAVETALYPALNTYLKSSACSGAVFCLDATANTALPGAATSRAGLYLRYSALRAIGATDQHVTCFRGAAETARSAQVQMHNRWNPELNVQAIPGYTQLLRASDGRLAERCLWTGRIALPDTWESVTLLCVPLLDSAGNVRGICGAELICDETTAATSCPYCGNPTVVPGQFSGALKPEFVLPFRMTKDDAVRALRAHYRGKPFLPRSFTAGNHIEEIQGVYVPFWLFDGGAEGEVDYKAANSRTYRDDDYEVTETDHYDVHRGGSIAFEKIPVDASSKMPDDHMDSIEPFDYTQMQPFSTAYLPGYLADKYDVTVDDSRARADRRSRETLENALRETVTGYGTCVTDRTDIRLHRGKVHYALLPVWMLSTKWNGESFLFAMNGQTGKLVGDLPTDRGRYWRTFGAIAGVVTVALTVILQFM